MLMTILYEFWLILEYIFITPLNDVWQAFSLYLQRYVNPNSTNSIIKNKYLKFHLIEL